MSPADDTSPPVRFFIESLRTVYEPRNNGDHLVTAWVAVGDIELEDDYSSYHTALSTWAGEQTKEPPLGAYRVVKHESYGSSLVEFEIVETREREIRRVERPEPVTERVRDDIETLRARPRWTPAGGTNA